MANGLTEKDIERLIQNLKFEPLRIKVLEQDYQFSRETRERADFLLDIEWKEFAGNFITEIKREGTPKKIEEALYELEKYRRNAIDEKREKQFFPLVIAPFLSEATLNLLIEREVSGIDLSGNGAVIVPGKIFVYRSGGKNKYPSNAPIKNVFSGISSIVARSFLLNPEYESVGAVVEEITRRGTRVSFSTVSKVLKTLEEELLVSRQTGIKLIDGKNLLKAIASNYRMPLQKRKITGKVPDVAVALQQICERAEIEKIRYAGFVPSRYTVMPAAEGSPLKIYTESIESLLGAVEFTETNRFPNLELIEAEDATIYFDVRRDDGFFSVSPLEVYLQLMTGGKREKETAENMVDNLLNFKYKN
jgi:hypothetical protein